MKKIFLLTLLVLASIVGAQDLTTGLVAHWPFDEGSGLESVDKSIYKNDIHMSYMNWADGITGSAINLTNASHFVTCDLDESLDLQYEFTISAWIYLNKYPDPLEDHGYMDIVNKWNSYQFSVVASERYTGVKWGLTFRTPNGYFTRGVDPEDDFQLNRWYHVAVVFDGNLPLRKFYIDGQARSVAPSDDYPVRADKGVWQLDVGSQFDYGEVTNRFYGRIDEVRIYNRTLAEGEVYNLWDYALHPNTSPTITSTAPTTANVDEQYVYSVEVEDPDAGDEHTFSLLLSPDNMAITSTGIIIWTPAEVDVGSHSVIVEVKDRSNEIDVQQWSITVAPETTVVSVPRFASVAPVEAKVDSQYSYNIEMDEPDPTEDFTFTLLLKPAGMTISISGTISWTPDEGDTGIQTIILQALNSQGVSAIQQWDVEVEPKDDTVGVRTRTTQMSALSKKSSKLYDLRGRGISAQDYCRGAYVTNTSKKVLLIR